MALESEKSFPFDSLLVNGVHDRRYVADDFARYFRTFISSGMFMKEADNLQVIANKDMSVTLRPGKIIIDGYRYDNIADIIITLSPADGVLNRVDRISLTWDKNTRDIHYTLQEGTPSYNAVPAECRRTAEYLDYVTADINVAAGAISISQADIVDQRLNTAVCGLAIPFGEIDTKTLYKQIQSDLDRFRTVTQADILQWFEDIKDILDENAMVNLQNQIGTLGGLQTETKESLVNAINELANKEIDVLDTAEAIKANTRDGKVAGAKGAKQLFEGVDKRLGGVTQFIVDNRTGEITGYKTQIGGADTVFPFRKVISLGEGTRFDVRNYGNFPNLTVDNFICEPIASGVTSGRYANPGNRDGNINFSTQLIFNKTYDPSTGIFTVNCYSRGTSSYYAGSGAVSTTNKAKVYLHY